jgi:hypothetical protein
MDTTLSDPFPMAYFLLIVIHYYSSAQTILIFLAPDPAQIPISSTMYTVNVSIGSFSVQVFLLCC